MEITIGVKHINRELTLEVGQEADAVVAAVTEALAKSADGDAGSVLDLTDEKGRRVVVPVASLGFVEIGAQTPRPVGFGTL
ncbi:DUF3107 domain-containing protein [Ruania halotolerans]|uniref:DUF3107 domain-containing protein n=1 Tax=Ruania halotolerans TaxID=2897773 RepID=UPI001E5B7364|nr:DUF3107 domain-containing protein [Ruania halotolerans]UFU05569.1 DUF3107 domain-containing protein [Ruania halotolerans]